jgi:RNA polymerase sigma factor (sigma-70 family)
MFTIAYSKAVDERRARARRAIPVERVPERLAEGSNDGVVLWDLVRELPPKQRASVVHRYANDLPYREIGRLLDITEAAARQNVREGLKKLKELV